MEFHLLYEGQLHVDNSDKARLEKHLIRKTFHKQLKRLWWTHPSLRDRARMQGGPAYTESYRESHPGEEVPLLSEDELIRWGVEDLAQTFDMHGFRFLPLITPKSCVRCSLEILFLRREEKDWIIQGGDIDGRVHVLFDALRMVGPGQKQELPPNYTKPDDDEHPFFCLLHDDKLIADVTINTGQLLLLPSSGEPDKHDVYLQITVKLNPTRSMGEGYWFF